MRRLAGEGLIDASLPPPVAPKAAPDRLLAVVAGIVLSEPKAIGARLEALRERTPRGGAGWRPGSVAHVIARARKAGLLLPMV